MKKLLLSLLLVPGFAKAAYTSYTFNGVNYVIDGSSNPTELQRRTFSGSAYQKKPDPAFLQNKYPLTPSERLALKFDSFDTLTQEEIDQIYIRSTSGPIVPGEYKGNIVMNGELKQNLMKSLTGIGGIDLYGIYKDKLAALSGCKDLVPCLGELIWSGKRIFPTNKITGVTELRNAINPDIAKALYLAFGMKNTSVLSRNDQVFYGSNRTMLFPAKVFCAQSLLDHRRESIVIDYAWTKDFQKNTELGTSKLSYFDALDTMGGKGYLGIRDEIRMVRPGLYLGRAYLNKSFALNFVLQNPSEEIKWTESKPLPADKCATEKSTIK